MHPLSGTEDQGGQNLNKGNLDLGSKPKVPWVPDLGKRQKRASESDDLAVQTVADPMITFPQGMNALPLFGSSTFSHVTSQVIWCFLEVFLNLPSHHGVNFAWIRQTGGVLAQTNLLQLISKR